MPWRKEWLIKAMVGAPLHAVEMESKIWNCSVVLASATWRDRLRRVKQRWVRSSSLTFSRTNAKFSSFSSFESSRMFQGSALLLKLFHGTNVNERVPGARVVNVQHCPVAGSRACL